MVAAEHEDAGDIAMNRARAGALSAALLSGLLLTACAVTPSTAPGAAPAGAYRLDPAHASLTWSVSHGGGLSHYVARFDRFDAALDFDAENPAASRLDVAIEAASISTGDLEFDAQIARAVFDAENHPEIRFTSTAAQVTGATTGRVTGDLMFKGVTAPVTLDVTFNGAGFDALRRADVAGFSATGVLDRTVFNAGVYTNFGVGAEVALQIEAEFLKD